MTSKCYIVTESGSLIGVFPCRELAEMQVRELRKTVRYDWRIQECDLEMKGKRK